MCHLNLNVHYVLFYNYKTHVFRLATQHANLYLVENPMSK